MPSTEYSQQVAILAPSTAVQNLAPTQLEVFRYVSKRRRKAVRSQQSILIAILEACRTPTVQHWIMVKARLGYDTFWKHMNMFVSKGMMDMRNDGYKTLYSVNEKGLEFLQELESSQER